MKIQTIDLLMLLKAIELANSKNAYNELEIQGFKTSFDAVHNFLNEYQANMEAQAKAQIVSETTSTEQANPTDSTVVSESVKIDTKTDTTKVVTKSKKSKKA